MGCHTVCIFRISLSQAPYLSSVWRVPLFLVFFRLLLAFVFSLRFSFFRTLCLTAQHSHRLIVVQLLLDLEDTEKKKFSLSLCAWHVNVLHAP